MWNIWERRKFRKEFSLGNSKKRDNLEELGIYEKIILKKYIYLKETA